MNIGMRESSRDEAFIEAINYWAERASQYENEYKKLRAQVDAFIDQFNDPRKHL